LRWQTRRSKQINIRGTKAITQPILTSLFWTLKICLLTRSKSRRKGRRRKKLRGQGRVLLNLKKATIAHKKTPPLIL
jgi:hypothetical protein